MQTFHVMEVFSWIFPFLPLLKRKKNWLTLFLTLTQTLKHANDINLELALGLGIGLAIFLHFCI